ncbi:MAG TPA: RagB/SusD family nutrient uptake outer membrane protein [Gemmatimonadales bacterium]
MTRHPLAALRALPLAALLMLACDLDLQNPNAPTEDEAFSTIEGVIAVAVGMQGQYAEMVEDYVLTSSLVTDEWGTRTRSLISYQSLVTGQNFSETYGVVQAPWAGAYRVVKSANSLVERAPQLGLGPGLETGIVSLARIFKAMALGTLIMQYDAVPIDNSVPGPVPQPRAVVLDTILTLLERARTDLRTVTDAELAGFNTRVLGAGLSLRNTVHAMLARHYLIDGQYQNAADAVDSVNLGVLSVFRYVAPNSNPIYGLAIGLLYVAPLRSFVTQAEAGDRRPNYWADTLLANSFVGNPDSVLQPLRKYAGQFDDYPAYLPDEMRLIKAEALTRLAQYAAAAALVNTVRTQTTSSLDEPVAGLPAIADALLDSEPELLAQIAYERRYELYMQGMRWEDTRRLGAAITTTPILAFLPIPSQECTTNPSAGC